MWKWITGKDLIIKWGIQPFEIFHYLKQGLPAYTSPLGKKVVDQDNLPQIKRDTLETIRLGLIVEAKRKPVMQPMGGPGDIRLYIDNEIKRYGFKTDVHLKKLKKNGVKCMYFKIICVVLAVFFW